MRSQLAALALHLSHVLHDLTYAMEVNNAAVAHRALLRFSSIAEEIAPLLADGEMRNPDLATEMRSRAEEALDVKERLMSSKTPDVTRLVKKISTSIAMIVKDLTGVMAAARYGTGGTAGV